MVKQRNKREDFQDTKLHTIFSTRAEVVALLRTSTAYITHLNFRIPMGEETEASWEAQRLV